MEVIDSMEVLEKVAAYAREGGILDGGEDAALEGLMDMLRVQYMQQYDTGRGCDTCSLSGSCTMIGRFGLGGPCWTGS